MICRCCTQTRWRIDSRGFMLLISLTKKQSADRCFLLPCPLRATSGTLLQDGLRARHHLCWSQGIPIICTRHGKQFWTAKVQQNRGVPSVQRHHSSLRVWFYSSDPQNQCFFQESPLIHEQLHHRLWSDTPMKRPRPALWIMSVSTRS